MKKFVLPIFGLTVFVLSTLAQAPQGFNYQSVIRDANNEPIVEQEVRFRISLQDDAGTITHYVETHAATTSPQGVVSFTVGDGTPVDGTYADIPWADGSVTLKVEVDLAGGNNYAELGVTPLNAVPYALYALSGNEGPKGEPGDDGVGIASIVHNDNGTLTINLTDDSSYTTEDITGPAGPLVEGTEGQILLHGINSWVATDDIYINSDNNVGIGTTSPSEKLEVTGNVLANQFLVPKPEGYDDLLFAVRNSNDKVVFAVYESGVRIYVDNEESGTKSTRSGFAIGGLTDVGKEEGPFLLQVNREGTTVRFDETGSKSTRSGFAIGGLTDVGKAIKNEYLTVTPANTTVRFDETAVKSTRSGFAIGGLTDVGKQTNTHSYMSITPENYLIGQEAGLSLTGLYNSFMGYQAGKSTTSGEKNIFIGYQTGKLNEGGSENIFIGNQAGVNNIVGKWNTFLGVEAGANNTGSDNTFIGYRAGASHNDKGGNVYLGSKAGENATHGEQNVFIGESTGQANTFGQRNVFMGFQSGFNNSGNFNNEDYGSYNLFLGSQSGYTNTIGRYNVYLGYQSGYTGADLQKNVFIGYHAGYNSEKGTLWWHGSLNVFVGNEAGLNNTTGGQNVALGDEALKNNTTGHWNIAIGKQALIGPNTGENNIAMGKLSLEKNESGSSNIAIGSRALNNNTIGSRNISIGGGLANNSEGTDNIGIGGGAGRSITTNSFNVAIGRLSLSWLDSEYNTTVGAFAGENLNTGEKNTLVGANVFKDQNEGSYLTAIGTDISGVNPNIHYENSIAVGYQTTINSSNIVRIGNTSITSISGQVDWTTYSDKRIKENLKDDVPGLEFITLLRPITYNINLEKQNKMLGVSDNSIWEGKNDISKIRFSGFVAQDVEEAAASIGYNFSGVDKEEVKNGGLYGLRYAEFVVPLVKAVQEQQEIIERLEEENDNLKARLERIEKLMLER